MESSIADKGTCETWPSFWRNVSTPFLSREGKELQGQQECSVAMKEYFIAKGWLQAKCISGTCTASFSLTQKYMTKCLFPKTQTLCKGG